MGVLGQEKRKQKNKPSLGLSEMDGLCLQTSVRPLCTHTVHSEMTEAQARHQPRSLTVRGGNRGPTRRVLGKRPQGNAQGEPAGLGERALSLQWPERALPLLLPGILALKASSHGGVGIWGWGLWR